MEDNYSDAEHISNYHLFNLIYIVAGKKNAKFLDNVRKLRNLIFVLLSSGIGISKDWSAFIINFRHLQLFCLEKQRQ